MPLKYFVVSWMQNKATKGGGGFSCSWVKSYVCLTICQCHPPPPLPSWLQRSVFVCGVAQGPSAVWVVVEPVRTYMKLWEELERKLGASVRLSVLSNVDGVAVLGTNEWTTPTSLVVEFWGLFLSWLMTRSHTQPPMTDFVHLPIHLGGIKPSTRRDRLSVALLSNVQCLVTAMLVENHQMEPCWYAGLSWRMCQLSEHTCSKNHSWLEIIFLC